jgi:hypothetical protein
MPSQIALDFFASKAGLETPRMAKDYVNTYRQSLKGRRSGSEMSGFRPRQLHLKGSDGLTPSGLSTGRPAALTTVLPDAEAVVGVSVPPAGAT